MAGHAAVLSYHANRNCFLNLPRAWASKHPRDKIIVYELRTENGVLYTNWAGGISVASSNGLDTVEINGLFAIKQNINHGDEVLVQQIPNIVLCTQVFVEPVSITDWEVLEQNAQNVEANMLNQVRVVWVEQVIPLWVQKSICIFVKIGRTVPEAQVCLLEQNTEVIVTPKVCGMSKQAGDLHKRSRNLDANNENSSNVTYTQVRDLSQNKFVEDLRKAASHYEVNQSGQNSAVSVSCDDVTENKDAVESLPHSSKRNVVKRTLAFMKSLWPWEKSMEYEQSGKSEQSNQQQYVNEYLKDPFDCSLRVQSLDSMLKEFNDDKQEPSNNCEKNMFLRQPNNVFITAETFFCACDSNLTETQPGTFLAKLTKLHSPVECEELAKKKSHFEKDQTSSTNGQTASEKPNNYDLLSPEGHNRKGFVVRVVVHDGKISQIHSTSQTNQFKWLPQASSGHVLISDVLRCQLNLEITAKVRLTAIKENGDVPKRIKFQPMFSLPSGYTSDMLLEAVKVWFEDTSDVCHPLVVNMPTVIQVPLKPDFSGYFLVTYTLSDAKDSHYCLVNSQTLQAVTLSIVDELKQDQLPARLKALCRGTVADLELPVPRIHLDQLGAVSSYIQQAVKHIDVSLAQRPLTQTLFMDCPGLRTGGLLLCGQKGIGKSSLARALCRCASQLPNLAYVAVIECKTLRGKRIEGLRKLFQKVFSEAVWRQPSVILLDDLDHITAAPSGPEQEMSGEALYYTRVSEVLKDIMNKTLTTNAKVTVMATSRSRSSIHQSLVSSRGQHYFQEIVEMKTLDLKRCVPVLRSILLNKPIVDAQCINDLDLDMIANWMEGYVPGDINMVVDRAIHAHYMLTQSDCDDSIKLTMADFTAALDGFTPASLKNVVLHKPGDVGWQNIGGLKEVKKTLIETLQWPAKYPKLFASCPLRLRSGLLLYGAPGTGKTLLAGAVAKECGLNFISIKGPELLSKYIGASEQAVRDTFMRAQAAKPCVLFFDEFDSLAPRRGHDSTGVTDRVVNQLLTQLDGIEGLEGVYVLGATSRPDLIDPALLRPGRLDKVLYCPMPDQDERLEILQSLTHNMTLDPSVDLTYLAITCDNFTGADLKALLYNAQLEAIHDLTGQTSLSEPGQTSSSEPGQTSLSDPGQTSLTKPVSATTNDTADGHQSEQNSNQNKTEVDSNCVVVEKNQRGKVTYIHRLEDGSLDLTPEDEQLLLAQFSKSTTPSVDEKKPTSVTVITQSHLVKALEGMRPSVSATERLKYQMIYANFMASKGANFNIEASAVGRKATLA